MMRMVSGIMLAFFIINMLTLAFSIHLAKPNPTTIMVPDDYPTIQEAINNANEGDTIYVHNGTYYENVVVNKTISLIGESRETTIIDAGGIAIAVEIECPFVTFKRFTVRNAWVGIKLSEKIIQNTIENTRVTNNVHGIWVLTARRVGYGENHTIKNNSIANNKYGLRLSGCEYNTIFQNEIKNNTEVGIMLDFHPTQHPEQIGSHNNIIFHNTIIDNKIGIYIIGRDNKFFHNNFVNNTKSVHICNVTSYINFWDDGYPSGGNYWSDYIGIDLYSDSYQNITGSDGIGDTPYIIDENNRDRYPLMKPWTPVHSAITATIYIDPNTLNLKSKERWVTIYIELPEGYNVSDIDISTMTLNGTILADSAAPIEVGDYDKNTITDLMVKFSGALVSKFILSMSIKYGNVTLTVDGRLYNGTMFQGSSTIKVKMPGDINIDGIVDMKDIAIITKSFGSYIGHARWNQATDENEDNKIDLCDVAITAKNFGKNYK